MTVEGRTGNRWLIVVMGTVLMICLGTVYAWSFFQDLIVREYADIFGWNNSQVAWIFSLAIFFLGVTAAWGGVRMTRYGPRKLAMIGGLMFGAGYLAAGLAFSLRSLLLLYLGYGVLGGIGLGLGYVTPVATVSKWFPDRKGLATGIVIMGFGLGALVMSKLLAPFLLELTGRSLAGTFIGLGLIFLVLGIGSAAFIVPPPENRTPQGGPVPATASRTARSAVLSGRFALIWTVFFCNITAGIAIIGFQSPLLQSLWRGIDSSLPAAHLAAAGATLIAVSSLFNGAGRFFWGAVSDRIGRVWTFRIMLGSEIAAFALLLVTANPWLFGALVCWVMLCYGGGFGTMPAYIADVFGARLMSAVYGAVLTAWAAAGIVGPQIVALLKDRLPEQASTASFAVGGAFLVAGFLLSYRLRSGRPGEEGDTGRQEPSGRPHAEPPRP